MTKTPAHKFSVRRPIANDHNLRREGMIVSEHRTLAAARAALVRQQQGAAKQGGYSQDYLWDDANDRAAIEQPMEGEE